MMIPTRRDQWASPVTVAVETAAGSGAFEVDDRLRADLVESLSDHHVAVAEIAVRTNGAFGPADAAQAYHPDRRIVVRAEGAVWFDGYPVAARLEWPERRPSQQETDPTVVAAPEFRLTLEHIVGRLARDIRAQIIGRYVRDGAIRDGLETDPPMWQAAFVPASGLPCIFNLGGAPNCDPVPLRVDDGRGGLRDVHLFCEDDRDDAIPWTYARTLRYLMHFYLAPDTPVKAAQLFEQTDALAALPDEGRSAYRENDPLAYALLARPDSLVAEAASLLEAIALLCDASGLHVTAESASLGSGVVTQIRVWSNTSGPGRQLKLASDAHDASLRDLFEANNLAGAMLSWDTRGMTDTSIVVGDVKRYAATVELVPGWLPEEGLDNVGSSLRGGAKSVALTDEQILSLGDEAAQSEWFAAYHRQGPAFTEHWRVGRLWVLNETGDLDPSLYSRNEPFDAYAPFDFFAVAPGPWMRRRRRLLPVAREPDGLEDVWVEVSFDDGTTWTPIPGGYQVLSDQCGLWFDAPNPLSVSPSGRAAEQNLWYALIDQTCRVRVTAMIESDDRLCAEASDTAAPTLLRSASVTYSPQRFQFVGKDELAMAREAARLAGEGASREVVATPIIPWLDREYQIGDRVLGVRGRGVELHTQRTPTRRSACVVGKRYRIGGGRWQTELVLASAETQVGVER